jgi:hypothetical protein
MEILAEGKGDYLVPDPDGFRAWVREHKPRTLVNKLMSEHDAVRQFVASSAVQVRSSVRSFVNAKKISGCAGSSPTLPRRS